MQPSCKTGDYGAVYSDVTGQVNLRFDEAGVSIQLPQADVHLHQVA